MDVDKVKKWVDFTTEFQKGDLWSELFDKYPADQFFQNNDKAKSPISKKQSSFPKIDMYKSKTHIMILMEVPGINPKDIQISLQSRNQLIVKGIVQSLFTSESVIKKERFHGEFERVIPLPEPTEPQLIQLYVNHGLMQVIYPRINETAPLTIYG